MNKEFKIAIIGGGVSGLSLAYFLHSKNIDFVLFEKEQRLGGNAHTRKVIHNNNFYALQGGFKYKEAPLSTRFNFKNGAGSWIENLVKAIPAEKIIRAESPQIVKTDNGFKIICSNRDFFVDKLAFACHADDLYNHYAGVLSKKQGRILSRIKYAKMLSVAHCDTTYLPVRKNDFSAYNCLVKDNSGDKNTNYTITYNCNEHQNLSNGGRNSDGDDDYFFVTVNPTRKIDDKYILKDSNGAPLVKEFSRNICDFDLLQSQQQLKSQQGKNDVYFVGGYTEGIGLHENCLNQSARIADIIHKGSEGGSKG